MRARFGTRTGELILMPDESSRFVGIKLVSWATRNPERGLPAVQGVFLLMDSSSLSPIAMIDAAELTLIRTSAMSVLVASDLNPAPTPRVAVIGSGPQAIAHAAAARLLRPESVTVLVRSEAAAARALVVASDRGVDVHVEVIGAAPDKVGRADVVFSCTAAREPILRSEDIGDDCVVVGMGSHEPAARELSGDLMRRAFVVVDSARLARAEAGDVILAEAEFREPVIDADVVDVLTGVVPIPSGRPRLFKSVGEAWQDLAVASAVADLSPSTI